MKFSAEKIDIFLIFAQNIDCGYSLEPPRRGGSNEYPQSMFWSKNKKNRYTPANPSFTIQKWGLRGVFIARACFPDDCKSQTNKEPYDKAKKMQVKKPKQLKWNMKNRVSENIETNNKTFWNYVQAKTKTREYVGNLVDNSGVTVTEGAKKQLYLISSSPVSPPKKNTDMPTFADRSFGKSLEYFEINFEMVETTYSETKCI